MDTPQNIWLCGMYTGMQMVNREGFTHLIVESDSKLLIDMVTRNCKLNIHTPILVYRIHDLAILHDNIAFKHTRCNGKKMCPLID